MLLKREGVRYHRVLRAGNEILRVRYAAAGGDSAAAAHTAALIEGLLSYAEGSLAERLLAEGAATEAHVPHHRYEIDWREEAEPWGCTVTLTTALYRGRELLEARTLMTCWDGEGACQCKPPKRRRQRYPAQG